MALLRREDSEVVDGGTESRSEDGIGSPALTDAGSLASESGQDDGDVSGVESEPKSPSGADVLRIDGTGHGFLGLAPNERPEDTGPRPPPGSAFTTLKTVGDLELQKAQAIEGPTWWRVYKRSPKGDFPVRGPTTTRISMDDQGNYTLPSGKSPAEQREEDRRERSGAADAAAQAAGTSAGASPAVTASAGGAGDNFGMVLLIGGAVLFATWRMMDR